MAYYESVFIARQDLTSSQVESLIEEFKGVITSNGGKFIKLENWGLRQLAYRIQKNRKGIYVMFIHESPAAALNEFDRKLRISEDILRHLTIKLDEVPEGPSVMMQRAEKEERRARSFDNRDAAAPAAKQD